MFLEGLPLPREECCLVLVSRARSAFQTRGTIEIYLSGRLRLLPMDAWMEWLFRVLLW